MASSRRTISEAFAARSDGTALMPYMMGGFPSVEDSLRIGQAYVEAGADLVELGVPFSDPLADGPVIQAAGLQALQAGASLDVVLDGVGRELAERLPVILMCYANPLMAHGLEATVEELASRSISGLIVPDLPAREAGELRAICDANAVDLVPLVAPTTPAEEIDRIASTARGFVYVVSVTGVTGERRQLPAGLTEVVLRVKRAASVPVAVGFGIATVEQAAEVARIADGVIVGSRLVRAMEEAADTGAGLEEIGRILSEIRRALD